MNIHIVIDDLSSMILNGINAILKEFREKDCISMIGELEPNKTRKRKLGRLIKLQGDLCLIFGDLKEAQIKYEESLQKHSSQNDWLWTAATFESLACISCVRGDYEKAIARFTDAENNYLKVGNGKLNIECQFRVARYMITCKKKVKAIKKLTRLLDSNPEKIDENDPMIVARNLGIFCKSIGFDRKAGFFMRLAASGCVHNNTFTEAHELLKQSAESCQITEEKFVPGERKREFDRNFFMSRENMKPWTRGDYTGWRSLQKSTLEHLKAIAKKIGDTESSVKYT